MRLPAQIFAIVTGVTGLAWLVSQNVQSGHQRELQAEAPGVDARNQTAAAMQALGDQAAREAGQLALTKQQAYEKTAAGRKLKELADEDRRWLAEHPLSPPAQPPATH